MIEEIYSKFLECGCLTTDSRAIKGGEMFLALKGDNFDGNRFALQALDAGARWAVVDGCDSDDGRLIHVEDSYKVLADLARLHRHSLHPGGEALPVIGLTGTNGKTTTKELIRSVLATTFNVCATEGNLNNDIGVPLSLLKLKSDTQVAVIEMGASHPEDITHLASIVEPDYGLITNVGRAHLLGFGSFEGVQKAKGRLYDSVQACGKAVFLNVDDPVLSRMVSERKGLSVIPYGIAYQNVEVLPSSPGEPFLRLKMGDRTVCTHLVGAYNATNVLAAIVVGRHFGVDLDAAIRAVEAYVPSNNRSQMMVCGSNSLIVDAYNANPSSMAAALDNFSNVEHPDRIALLGDMRELGEESLKEHVAIVERLAGAPYKSILVGEEFRRALVATGADIKWFATSDDLAEWLGNNPVRDSVVLVKGSRGIRMEKCLEKLGCGQGEQPSH